MATNTAQCMVWAGPASRMTHAVQVKSAGARMATHMPAACMQVLDSPQQRVKTATAPEC